MRPSLPRRAVLGASAAWWAAVPGPSRAATPAGRVSSARGECFATTGAARRGLAPDAQVFVGDAVGTGAHSALGLSLGQTTQVRLGANARLRIDRFLVNAGGVLALDGGPLLYDHDEAAQARAMAVRSPFGLIAVRGTRFFAGPSNNVFGVFVARGVVTVVGVNQEVEVKAGYGTNIARPGAEPTAPAPWGAARIAAAMRSVE